MWFEDVKRKRGRLFSGGRRRRPVWRVHARVRTRDRARALRVAVAVLVPVAVAVAGLLAWLGLKALTGLLFSRNDRFTVRTVEVRAASARTRSLAREYTRIAEGMNLFGFDIAGVRDYVMAHAPNFRSMIIRRHLPDTVVVQVVERTPLVRIGRGDFVVDAEGCVFVLRSGLRDLPMMRGYRGESLKPGSRLEGMSMAALRFLEACDDPALEMRVLSVAVDDPEHLVARFAYGGRVREVKLSWKEMDEDTVCARRDLLLRLGRLKQVMDSPEGQGAQHLDATFDRRVYIE